jgi:hypothetical protein
MIKALQDLRHESGSSPYSWYARAEPLPLSKVVAVHTMVYPDNRWQPFHLSAAEVSTVEGRPDIMGVRIGDGIFFGESYVNPDGVTGYKFKPAVPVASFAQACLSSTTARGLPSEASGGSQSSIFHWSRASFVRRQLSSHRTARRGASLDPVPTDYWTRRQMFQMRAPCVPGGYPVSSLTRHQSIAWSETISRVPDDSARSAAARHQRTTRASSRPIRNILSKSAGTNLRIATAVIACLLQT